MGNIVDHAEVGFDSGVLRFGNRHFENDLEALLEEGLRTSCEDGEEFGAVSAGVLATPSRPKLLESTLPDAGRVQERSPSLLATHDGEHHFDHGESAGWVLPERLDFVRLKKRVC